MTQHAKPEHRIASPSRTRRGADRVRWCRSVAVAILLAGSASRATGQAKAHFEHNLGTVHFPISCSEPARAAFDRAIVLLHHMTYPQARAGFQQAATLDPRCAMATGGSR